MFIIVHCTLPNEERLKKWKISLTNEITIPLIKCYHTILAYKGTIIQAR